MNPHRKPGDLGYGPVPEPKVRRRLSMRGRLFFAFTFAIIIGFACGAIPPALAWGPVHVLWGFAGMLVALIIVGSVSAATDQFNWSVLWEKDKPE